MTLAFPVAGAVAGAIVGSFLATLCIRWPRGEQVVAGRSACDGCGRHLGPSELVPLLSRLWLRGRCGQCGAAIAPTHAWMEAGAALLAATALALQPNLHGVALALFWLLLLAPAVLDARHFWLPDRLTAVLALGGIAVGGFVSGASLLERIAAGAGAFLVLALVTLAYRRVRGRDGMGAGDVKLFAAIGLWTGAAPLPVILLLASIAGLGAAVIQGRRRIDRIPFGTCLVFAAIAWSAWVSWTAADPFAR